MQTVIIREFWSKQIADVSWSDIISVLVHFKIPVGLPSVLFISSNR